MPRALILLLLAASLFFTSFAGASRPNVVLILSDDQRVDDMRFMPKTRQLLTNKGTTFTRMFAPFPLCCPARMSILTGQYSHKAHVSLFAAKNRKANTLYKGYNFLDKISL